MAKGTINKVILVGRLGGDPEVRFIANGTAVANFTMATNERVPAGEGNWEDRTEWHRIVVFGKTAEFCGNYLSKGRLVYVEGSLRTRQWEDAQGVKRYTTEIVARDVQSLSSPSGEERGQPSERSAPQSYGRGGTGSPSAYGGGYPAGPTVEELPPAPPQGRGGDEDIPF